MVCFECAAPVMEGSLYCHNCGARLDSGPAERPPGTTPWGVGDMARAIGLVAGGIFAVSIPAALLAAMLAGDLGLRGDRASPLGCGLSICARRIVAEVKLDDVPIALAVILGAGFFVELFLLFTAVNFSVRKYGARWADLGLRWPSRGGIWLAVPLVITAYAIVIAYFQALAAVGIEPDTDLPEQAFENAGPIVVIALLSLLFAPVMEEVFFRGFVFGGLRGRWGLAGAALASGALFSLAHIGNPGSFYIIPPIAAVGALFAVGYAYSGSIFASIIAHFLFNLVSFGAGLAST